MEENRMLKNIVAKQQIEMEFKTELLKNVNSTSSGGRVNSAISIESLGEQERTLSMVRYSRQ
jgi:hypothetical protein